MRPSTEFSADVARRAQDLRETLDEAGHSPDSLRVARDNPTYGNLVEARFGVEDAAEGVDKATSLLEDVGDEDLPEHFYMDEEGRDVGPADLGVVWKAIEEPDEEEPETAEWPADVGPADFPEAWRDVEEVTGMGLATLVELMTAHVEDHTLERLREAVSNECRRREAWETHEATRTLSLGSRTLLLTREVEPDPNRAANVARTSPDDPRGDA